MAQANLRAKLYDEAVENMRIAYELDPDSPLVLAVLADQKLREYRVQEALDLYKRAQEVDPMSALWFENTFRPLLLVQRFDEAVRAAREAYERHADANQLNKNLGDIHLLRKEFDQALEYYNLVPMNAVVWPPNSHLVGLAATHFGAGNKAESAAMVERIKAMQGPFTAWELMLVAAHRQDFDEAFERLHKFQHLQAPGVRKEPMLMILHDDPRWRPFVASLPDPFPPQ